VILARLLVIVSILVIVFVLLLRALPSSWSLPLYFLFAGVGMIYAWSERQRLLRQRSRLEDELDKHQDWHWPASLSPTMHPATDDEGEEE
jgi:hypothetical protein